MRVALPVFFQVITELLSTTPPFFFAMSETALLLVRTIPVISVVRALKSFVFSGIIYKDLFDFDKLKTVIPSFFLVFVFFVATLVLPAWLLELSFRLLLGRHL